MKHVLLAFLAMNITLSSFANANDGEGPGNATPVAARCDFKNPAYVDSLMKKHESKTYSKYVQCHKEYKTLELLVDKCKSEHEQCLTQNEIQNGNNLAVEAWGVTTFAAGFLTLGLTWLVMPDNSVSGEYCTFKVLGYTQVEKSKSELKKSVCDELSYCETQAVLTSNQAQKDDINELRESLKDIVSCRRSRN